VPLSGGVINTKLLSVDGNGDVVLVSAPNAIPTANQGLIVTGTNVQLGGLCSGVLPQLTGGKRGIGNAGLGGGRIAIGNNLPEGFTAQARLHIHQIGGNANLRFTANANDTTATDGLEITLSPNGTASITNNEGALTLKDANNQITIAQLTALVLEVNQLKTEVNQLKKTLTANNLALVN